MGKALEKFLKGLDMSPIKEDLGVEKRSPGKTTKEHITELQERLVQTCIDFINEKGLDDIYLVEFNADALADSAKEGKWTGDTDSWIAVDGIQKHKFLRESGKEIEITERYRIGERF